MTHEPEVIEAIRERILTHKDRISYWAAILHIEGSVIAGWCK